MDNWEEIVQEGIVKYSDQTRKVTQPLREHFGVSYFSYHRIDKQGRYTVLVDRPDFAEHYVAEQFYREDPYLRHPDVYTSGLCCIGMHGSENYKQKIVKSGLEHLHLDIGVMVIEKSDDYVDFFGFAAKKEKSCLEKIYLNRPYALKSFARHFRQKLNPILNHLEENSSPLMDLKGDDFLEKELIGPDISNLAYLAYLADLGLKVEIAQAAALSFRERQCLRLLLDGQSAKETGAVLGLSPRTVEFYFENIKSKFSCYSKHELLFIAKRLEELALLQGKIP